MSVTERTIDNIHQQKSMVPIGNVNTIWKTMRLHIVGQDSAPVERLLTAMAACPSSKVSRLTSDH